MEDVFTVLLVWLVKTEQVCLIKKWYFRAARADIRKPEIEKW